MRQVELTETGVTCFGTTDDSGDNLEIVKSDTRRWIPASSKRLQLSHFGTTTGLCLALMSAPDQLVLRQSWHAYVG